MGIMKDYTSPRMNQNKDKNMINQPPKHLLIFMRDINTKGRKRDDSSSKKKTAAALLEQPLSPKEKLKSTSCIPNSLGAE
jgi:hypothetical protein